MRKISQRTGVVNKRMVKRIVKMIDDYSINNFRAEIARATAELKRTKDQRMKQVLVSSVKQARKELARFRSDIKRG